MAVEPFRPIELMQDKNFTQSDFTDFIGVWENFVPKPLCEEIIAYADKIYDYSASSPGVVVEDKHSAYKSENFYGGATNRKDISFILSYAEKDLSYKINACLNACIKHYITEYPSLSHSNLMSTDIKFQKTPPGGGYHLWHYENSDMTHALRDVVWMIYLNDMPDDGGGETEFLYQRRRIKPTAGTVVIWPATYTHTHKGNTVLTEDKYILTGWYIKSK